MQLRIYLLLLLGGANTCLAQLSIKECNIYKLQNKNIILPPFTFSSYKQSVYTKDALVKKQFKEKFRYSHNIYGEPIHIDSVYMLNFKKQVVTELTRSDEMRSNTAVIMEFTHKGNKVVYYFPMHYSEKHRNESYHFHNNDPKEHPLGGSYLLSPNLIDIRYYDFNKMDKLLSLYKDSVVIDTTDNREYVLRAVDFKESKSYRDQWYYWGRKYLNFIVEDVKTRTTRRALIEPDSDNRFDMNTLSSYLRNWITKQRCVDELQKESSVYIDKMRNLIGDTIYIKSPSYWGETRQMLNGYSSSIVSSKDYSSIVGSTLYYIEAILCGIDIKIIEPERYDSNRNRYRYFAQMITIKKNYNKNERDTLSLQLNEDVVKDIIDKTEFENLTSKINQSLRQESEMFNTRQKASYNYAVKRWGKKIADIVEQGEVRFGFTPDMCREAYKGEPFYIDHVQLPMGYATMYHFKESNTTLYFIQNKLIGIKYPMSDIRYNK